MPLPLSEIEIITVEDVCELLKVQPSFIYEKTRRRQRNPLPVHRIGKYLRFRRSEVMKWFDAQSNVGALHAKKAQLRAAEVSRG